jgi:hypothetical protein
MRRPQLEHIIRAAAGITGASEFVVIGSQAVLGQFPDPPAELLISMEADLFTFRSDSDAELIDGSIGEASPFHRTSATMPTGSAKRLLSCLLAGRTGSFRFEGKTLAGGCVLSGSSRSSRCQARGRL